VLLWVVCATVLGHTARFHQSFEAFLQPSRSAKRVWQFGDGRSLSSKTFASPDCKCPQVATSRGPLPLLPRRVPLGARRPERRPLAPRVLQMARRPPQMRHPASAQPPKLPYAPAAGGFGFSHGHNPPARQRESPRHLQFQAIVCSFASRQVPHPLDEQATLQNRWCPGQSWLALALGLAATPTCRFGSSTDWRSFWSRIFNS